MFVFLMMCLHLTGVAVIWNLACPKRAARLFRVFGLVLASDAQKVLHELKEAKKAIRRAENNARATRSDLVVADKYIRELHDELDAVVREHGYLKGFITPAEASAYIDLHGGIVFSTKTVGRNCAVSLVQAEQLADKPHLLTRIRDDLLRTHQARLKEVLEEAVSVETIDKLLNPSRKKARAYAV